MADALAIFRRTVGFDSPLTANAMGCLGKVRCELGQMKEGLKLLKDALRLEIQNTSGSASISGQEIVVLGYALAFTP